ncbi:MAG: DUF4038 domain-containing protein [Chloroflexi bacterium]|nr:DUF4038 domain-containing protein [Chloroflexota bacterium]
MADSATTSQSGAVAPLRLSENRRYLVDATGQPFFFLADTAWSIVWKGQPDQWAAYLDRRKAQGFSVVQVDTLPWTWGAPDADGNVAFYDGDPERPNEAYFQRYDRFVEMAAERGLFTCLMLIWGGPRPHLSAVHFSTEQAARHVAWLVRRYTRFPVLWSLSGDAPYDEEPEKWDAVGRAVEAADPNGHPTTNHLMTQRGWRFLHHDASWHDFHMIQTGHYGWARPNVADTALAYYRAEPVKAYVNGEPWYEGHPDMTDRPRLGPLFTAEHARYAFWVSVLSGATMGHTYGSQGIWNWKRPGDSEEFLAGPQIGETWDVGLKRAGGEHCGIGARKLRTLPWYELRPAPERVRAASGETLRVRQPACGLIEGSLWLVYCPDGSGAVELLGLNGDSWQAAWFDPRTGAEQSAGAVTPPENGVWPAPARPSAEDWVLILTR